MIVYKATNKLNNKSYIGITTRNLPIRITEHFAEASKTKMYFHKALNKYGKDMFLWEIVEVCDNIDGLSLAEEWYIRYFNTLSPNGYNVDSGGFNGSIRPLIRKKISETVLKNHGFRGKHHSKKSIEKIREASKKLWTKEYYRKIMLAFKGVKHPMYGKHHTEKAKMKISEKQRRYYSFISPEGVNIELDSSNIQHFCMNNDLSYQMMLRLNREQVQFHRGWTV